MKIKINLEQHSSSDTHVPVPQQPKEVVIRSPLSPLLFPLRLMAAGLQTMCKLVGWGVVGTGYTFAALMLLIGIFFNVIGLLNLGNGIGATLFAFGLCFIPMGLASPLFYGSQLLKKKLHTIHEAWSSTWQTERNAES